MSNAMNGASKQKRATKSRCALGGGSVARRPLKRDPWIRGFVCAVAAHWNMTEDPNTDELLRLAGKVEQIMKHADEEDIATLQAAGLLQQNNKISNSVANKMQ